MCDRAPLYDGFTVSPSLHANLTKHWKD
jgi:hypothetical protein